MGRGRRGLLPQTWFKAAPAPERSKTLLRMPPEEYGRVQGASWGQVGTSPLWVHFLVLLVHVLFLLYEL